MIRYQVRVQIEEVELDKDGEVGRASEAGESLLFETFKSLETAEAYRDVMWRRLTAYGVADEARKLLADPEVRAWIIAMGYLPKKRG